MEVEEEKDTIVPDILPVDVHAPGLSPAAIQDMQEQLRRPEGTLIFDYRLQGLVDPSLGSGIILQIPAGNTLFRLERDDKLHLRFIHSSPGTGTRVAEVDLNELEPTESLKISVTWSSQEIALYVGYVDRPCQPIMGRGYLSTGKKFRVGQDGHIYEIGDEGVQVMGVSIFQGGQPVLQDTALDSWSGVVEAVRLLLANSRSPAGYLLEVVMVNQVLVMLVTGFETYCKRRFLEMEMEGRAVNFEKLIERGRINFQNFAKCKRAYSTRYGISFGRDLGICNQVLEFLQRIIQYRHRIVHISPMIGLLNQGCVPPDDPVFPKVELGQQALETFDEFIRSLHRATLKVPAPDRK